MLAAVIVTVCGWLALEPSLVLRDRLRGNGSADQDQGTRALNTLAGIVGLSGAGVAAVLLRHDPGWQTGSWHLAAALAVMWAGLALRIWSILVLGAAFRSTITVDARQPVVDHGPYRWIRHPSYTGALVTTIGVGLAFGNWLSLAIAFLLPTAAMMRRISVEERALTEVLGQPYVSYRERTKRLLPGLW